jgi:cyclohexa-1,5-dienecarbonyl-CoA hydratase
MAVRTAVTDGVGSLILSNPPLNLLTREVLRCIRTELERLAAESALRALVLSADGKHFSAGASVEEHLPPQHEELIPEFLATVTGLDTFPLPVIAAVRGRCLGGGMELILAADIVVAAQGATFGQPEIRLGVVPPAACALLPGLCPRGAAAEIVYTGDPLSADDAWRAGLVTRVVPDDELEPRVRELADRIARHSAAALRAAKHTLRGGQRAERAAAIARAGYLYRSEVMQTGDAVEGLTAFLEKRRPEWKHR